MPSHRIRDVRYLAAHYALNGNALDGTGRYDAALFNTPTWGRFLTGRQCIEFDGNNQYANCGDILELNAVSAFTLAFWMNQDVLDVTDAIFDKGGWGVAESGITISTAGGGQMYLQIDGSNQRGFFDYSTVISALNWHHIAVVFNGVGTGNTGRLQCYVDGTPVALAYTGTIPAATDDLSGIDATIGRAAASFDGELYDFRIASCAYSRDEVIEIIHQAVPV